jgi:hypothetical protein
MPHRSTAFKACALLLASLFCSLASATPQPLADTEMSAVRGADGSILVGLQPSTSSSSSSSSNSQNPFTAGLSAAFASSTGATMLTPEQFAVALQGSGLTPAMFGDYSGQPVAQVVVDAKPVTFSFNFSDILQSTTGLQYNGGPSMGTITLKDFDARGTTIWVWTHH